MNKYSILINILLLTLSYHLFSQPRSLHVTIIDDTVTNPTDVVTKGYIDSAIASGFSAKTPARVVGMSNITLSGMQTIDGVSVTVQDRVLLINQTNSVENGLWLVQSGAWTRPIDFNTGDVVGQAYVLITSGTLNAGSSWLCNTTTAVVDTDTIVFVPFSLKTPAFVVSTSDVTLSGVQTIDGVPVTVNDRVLLISQTNPVENGLWLVRSGAWTRPTDFNTGNVVGQAYVLVTSGTLNAGSGWVCNTPMAMIDTDTIVFLTLSLLNQITGANVGTGAGQLFKNKTVNTLNFKTIAAGDHVTIINNGNNITVATDATDVNLANTIISRNTSGGFSAGTITANVTGSASLNLLKSGDVMTGSLVLPAGSTTTPALKFTGSSSSAGISAATPDNLVISAGGKSLITAAATGITLGAKLIHAYPTCDQALQISSIASGGTITANANTSVLLITPPDGLGAAVYTIIFPPSPTDGQCFTILNGSAFRAISCVNSSLSSIINGITSLNLLSIGLGSSITSVTYIYSAVNNSWYRMRVG